MKLKSLALIALSILVVLSCTLLSAAAAEESDYSDVNLRIVSKNLSYKDATHLLVACDTDGVASDKVELVMWNALPSSVTDAPTFVDSYASPYYDADGELLFETVFESYGISAKDMPDYIYMAAHIKGTDVYSKIYRYSALEYLYERLASGEITDGSITEEQEVFYHSVIEYAENAQIVLKHDAENSPHDLNYVAVKGGTISDGFNTGTYSAGSEVTISASSPDTFSMWVDATGNIVSTDAEFTTTADDKFSVFYSVKGYSVTVNIGDQTTSTLYTPGQIAELSAPSYIDSDAGRMYFIGWTNAADEAISTAATTEVTVNASETYTANYSLIADISGHTLLDYSTTSHLPGGIAFNATDRTSQASEFTSIARRNQSKMNGYALLLETARENPAYSLEYVNTFFDASSTASSAHFAFDILFNARDIDGSGTNNKADYTTSPSSNTLYTLSYTSGNVTRSIRFDLALDGDIAQGINLVAEDETVIATLDFDSVYNLSAEISKHGDKTITSIYLNGAKVDTTEIDTAYEASADASTSLCIGMMTTGRVYIDNTAFYTAN